MNGDPRFRRLRLQHRYREVAAQQGDDGGVGSSGRAHPRGTVLPVEGTVISAAVLLEGQQVVNRVVALPAVPAGGVFTGGGQGTDAPGIAVGVGVPPGKEAAVVLLGALNIGQAVAYRRRGGRLPGGNQGHDGGGGIIDIAESPSHAVAPAVVNGVLVGDNKGHAVLYDGRSGRVFTGGNQRQHPPEVVVEGGVVTDLAAVVLGFKQGDEIPTPEVGRVFTGGDGRHYHL